MEPISNVDRLVSLLRQRLEERDKTRSSVRPGSRTPQRIATGIAAAQALAAVEDIDDRQLRRALIQGLLTDQFGEQMLNEPRFQQMVDRVVGAIDADATGRALLDRLSRDLRAAAKP
ncbi:hypothetical protein [Brevundimonas sp.]|uniref:hypothetical protein n=1 Tax=Brevundimonas sp. TaxID=1871086 RepID=UPI002D2B5318|nr:hypothetical protein [Brevundimonas sp.]HYC68858.1 hypothetical protein [Brevundimonas sp.]